jgi:hypothetical protein
MNNNLILNLLLAFTTVSLAACNSGTENNTTVPQNQNLHFAANGTTGSTCDNIATWNAATTYAIPESHVVQSGKEYKNNWWTRGDSPDANNGVSGTGKPWTFVTNCGVVPTPTPTPTASPSPSPSPSPTPTPTPSPSPTPAPVSGLPTPIHFTPLSTASGTINYHLNLPYGSGNVEKLTLSANHTDLIISNYISGALLGRLMQAKDPKLNFNKDYIYGTVFGQLLQENIDTAGYTNTTDWINANDAQRASLLASGQGGPYQINDYSKRLENEKGIGLVNYVALQKGLGYTVEAQDSGAQTAAKGPDSLDQKYFGPIAAAYFHLNDMNRLAMNNADTWGPQYAYYAKCMANLENSSSAQNVNNIYDLILNAAYNAGTYSMIINDYFRVCAGMYTTSPEMTQLKSLGDYTLSDSAYKAAIGTKEAAGSTFILYPRQIRIYLDQMYNQKTFNSDAIPGTNSIRLSIQDIKYVFQNSMGTLAYINANNVYGYIESNNSKIAFESALTSNQLSISEFVDISTPTGKAKFFKLLEDSISNLATNLKIDFGAVTQTTIGGVTPTPTPTPTPSPTPGGDCPTNRQVYPAGRGSYVAGSIVKASDGKLYSCNATTVAWCNGTAEWAYAPVTGALTLQEWSEYICK